MFNSEALQIKGRILVSLLFSAAKTSTKVIACHIQENYVRDTNASFKWSLNSIQVSVIFVFLPASCQRVLVWSPWWFFLHPLPLIFNHSSLLSTVRLRMIPLSHFRVLFFNWHLHHLNTKYVYSKHLLTKGFRITNGTFFVNSLIFVAHHIIYSISGFLVYLVMVCFINSQNFKPKNKKVLQIVANFKCSFKRIIVEIK